MWYKLDQIFVAKFMDALKENSNYNEMPSNAVK